MSKPKVAFYWCASCGGCEETVVDLHEAILNVVAAVDIILWPVALDFKRSDVEKMPDGSIAVSFINGAIRSSEQFEMVEMLREKSGLVVAFGSCAQLGGIPGLGNLFDRRGLLETVYKTCPSLTNGNATTPAISTKVEKGSLSLPELWDTVKTLDQVIKVDYYLPGCPPPPNLIADAVTAILSGKLPPPGSVLAPDMALCEDCPRRDSKPDKIQLSGFHRPHEINIEPDKCLLAQGLLCLGSVTRQGCGSVCVNGNMPCTGCMGPTSHVADYGAKALSAIASMVNSNDEAEIAAVLDKIADPLGTFYRYSLPASLLHRAYAAGTNGGKK